MEEDLIEGFDNFVIGNFEQCLELCQRARPGSDFARFLWDSLTARCHLALNHMDKVKEMKTQTSSPALQGTAYFAVLLKSQQEAQRKTAAEKVLENATLSSNEAVSCYYACVARAIGGDLIDAIHYAQSVASSSPSEFNALRAQFSLAIDRPDLSEKILSESAKNRDDSAACKLVSAMHALITGKPSEAAMSYSDLIAQFSAEAALPLANGRAVAQLQRGMAAEGVEDLEQALSSNATDSDTVRNMIAALTLQGKSAEAREWLSRLAPQHSLHAELNRLNAAFAEFATA
jgi:tetratricopeptide (TPR) repeat protein